MLYKYTDSETGKKGYHFGAGRLASSDRVSDCEDRCSVIAEHLGFALTQTYRNHRFILNPLKKDKIRKKGSAAV